MKTTYKLLNIYLDGRSLPTRIPNVFDIKEVPECCELEEEIIDGYCKKYTELITEKTLMNPVFSL